MVPPKNSLISHEINLYKYTLQAILERNIERYPANNLLSVHYLICSQTIFSVFKVSLLSTCDSLPTLAPLTHLFLAIFNYGYHKIRKETCQGFFSNILTINY